MRQKTPRMIHIIDLAEYIDKQRMKGRILPHR
ncbi:pyocin activator PrtN family protein [Rouxiella badensis]|nr:pyocin activator PrtN family protein [Rouxiella badensis]